MFPQDISEIRMDRGPHQIAHMLHKSPLIFLTCLFTSASSTIRTGNIVSLGLYAVCGSAVEMVANVVRNPLSKAFPPKEQFTQDLSGKVVFGLFSSNVDADYQSCRGRQSRTQNPFVRPPNHTPEACILSLKLVQDEGGKPIAI